MSENEHEALHEASRLILEDRRLGQLGDCGRMQTYAVYVTATPIPDDAHPAVKITEAALKAHIVATAKFHAGEVARFKAALKELEATK